MKAHHSSWRFLVVGLTVGALVATACGPAPTETGQATTAPTTPAPAEQAIKGGRIILGSFSDIKTMQPMLVNDVPSRDVTDKMYESIIQADPKTGEIKPRLAKWTVATDGLTYTWEMDAKANWSDGKPVIGEDWITGLKAVGKSKATVRKTNFSDVAGFKDYSDGKATDISGVKADTANPKKWTITFTRIFCPALIGASGYVLPTQVFGKYVTATSGVEIDTAPENVNPQVVNGPFKFKEWRQGDQVILTRNETFYLGAPLVDEFIYKVVADTTVLAAQLKTGELNLGTIDPKDLADIERQENLKVFKYPSLGYTYIGWNLKSATAPALADKKVRQALAYGIDTDAYIKAVLFGEGTKQVSHHVPVQWASPGSAGLQLYNYDAAKAESLLKEAGYAKGADGLYAKDGKKISFTIVTNAGNKKREALVQIAAEQYKKIGVEAKPKLEAFATMVDKLSTGNQEIEAWIIGWSLGLEVDPQGIWGKDQIPDAAAKRTGFNFGGYTTDAVQKAIDEGRTPTDKDCSTAARKKHYETFNKILNEDQPYNFGVAETVLAVAQKNMVKFDPGSFSSTYNIHEWWFRK